MLPQRSPVPFRPAAPPTCLVPSAYCLLPTAFRLLPTVLYSGTGVDSTISRRMESDWSDFFMVER